MTGPKKRSERKNTNKKGLFFLLSIREMPAVYQLIVQSILNEVILAFVNNNM